MTVDRFKVIGNHFCTDPRNIQNYVAVTRDWVKDVRVLCVSKMQSSELTCGINMSRREHIPRKERMVGECVGRGIHNWGKVE